MMTAEEVTGELVSPFYITATASTGQQNSRTLKSRDTFIVLDPWGDAQAFGPAAEGLFHKDTRFLSHLVLQLNGMRPVLLSSTVARENEKLATDLTNPDIYDQGNLVLARDSLHLLRTKIVGPAHCFEAIDIRSFADRDVTFTLLYGFGADFADIFEVRGRKREKRGRLTREEGSDSTAVLGYRGLDRVHRRTRLTFTPAPDRLTRAEALYRFTLPAHGEARVELTIACEIEGEPDPAASSFTRQREENVALARERRAEFSLVTSSNNSFDAWIDRSRVDLAMLITDKKTGPYPYAGIPWFSTAFGRDGLITAFECLWVAPDLARGVLEFLAANQANEISDAMDAEPGKILHETRHGEMAALYEVPFGRYYGSIDSTPLFIMLAAAYWERSGDIMFIDKIWPNLELALQWMARFGDLDGDGFLEYGRRSGSGLINQGWKDSSDAIFHADGRLAEGPIALIEVQAYAFAAWRGAALLARAMGKRDRYEALGARAIEARRRFEEVFWSEKLSTYILALDGGKHPCEVRTSNAGHALFAGIAPPRRAALVAASLLNERSFSDWGIRTVAEGEARYNPMSYHNGSVWPHDNGLIAMGFARYGLREPLLRVWEGLFHASQEIEAHRLPELFCGFPRRYGEGPTAYPVACNPQAWSSAASYALLGAGLGISFHPPERQIRFTRPMLPSFLEEVRLEGLRMGDISVDLLFRRHNRDAALNVLRKEGEVEIVVISG